MSLVTIGTMVPFDRMLRAVDDWAAAHPGEDVVEISAVGDYQPKHMRSREPMPPSKFADIVSAFFTSHTCCELDVRM